MSKDMIERLKQAIEASGKSARAISMEAKMSADAIRGIMRNPDASPTVETIMKLSRALGVSPEWLAFNAGTPGEISVPKQSISRLQIVGEVAAGLWMDPVDYHFDPIPYDVPADARYPENSQFLLRVRGNSINRKAPDGALLRCVETYAVGRKPRHDDWVIVVRKRGDGTTETTVKRLAVEQDGSMALWPDSDDPRYKEPIPFDARDGDEISIAAFVLDFILPATRI